MATTEEKVSLIITSTAPGGTVKQKSFTDISPEASYEQLLAFSRAVNNLTDNTYGRTDKVTKVNVDNSSGGGKQTPTFTVSPSTISLADFTTNYLRTLTLSYDGDATRFWVNISGTGTQAGLLTAQGVWNNNGTLMSVLRASDPGPDFNPTADLVVTYRTEETDNFKAAQATCTITI